MAGLHTLCPQKACSTLLLDQLSRQLLCRQSENQTVETRLRLGFDDKVTSSGIRSTQFAGCRNRNSLKSTVNPVSKRVVAFCSLLCYDRFNGRRQRRAVT
jgi:hypothetical protein